MDENIDKVGTLFYDQATAKYEEDVKEMFAEISQAASESRFCRLLDYRNYLNFDIKIINNGKVRLYSKMKFMQSGGEGQVPFYIIAAISFQQLLLKGRKETSNLCLVLFDEAFNNMDAQRIQTMMEFYNSLSLQIFLSLTSEKIHNIEPYMDTSLAVLRDDDLVYVNSFNGRYSDD